MAGAVEATSVGDMTSTAVRRGLDGLLQVQTQAQSDVDDDHGVGAPAPAQAGQAQVQSQVQGQVQAQVQSQAQGPAAALYDALKEETAKLQQDAAAAASPGTPTTPAPAFIEAAASLQHPQQQLAAAGLLSGPGTPGQLQHPHGLLGPGASGPGMMHLKYMAHPSLRMPLAHGLGHGHAMPLSMPLSRPQGLAYAYKHGPTKHAGMSLMHSHRHPLGHGPGHGPGLSMSSHMLRRPIGQAPRPGPGPQQAVASPSQHNYVIKQKPHYRVPVGAPMGVGVPFGMGMGVSTGLPLLSSTTLRPLYLPAANLYTSTLKPSFAQTLMAAQAQAQAQAQAHAQQAHQQQQALHAQAQQQALVQQAQAQAASALREQLYSSTKLHKLMAALSTTTHAPTTTTTTTTPAPVTVSAPLHSIHPKPHGHSQHPNHHSVHSVQSFPAYYRPASHPFPAAPPLSPAFDADSLEDTAPGSLGPLSAGPLAINTGFNPSSVVVEGGFKPILQRRHDQAEDRMAFVEGGDDSDELMEGSVVEMERRSSDIAVEDEDVVDEEDGDGEDLLQERRTETFEPMFIPSPPDRNSFKPGSVGVSGKKASEPGKALQAKPGKHVPAPANNKQARRDKPARLTPLIVRPRPSILRRPLYPNMVVPPFKIQAQSRRGHHEKLEPEVEAQAGQDAAEDAGQQDDGEAGDEENDEEEEDVQDETMMAAERMDTYYLPPSAPAPAPHRGQQQLQQHTILTYDGKTVDPAIAASIPQPPPDTIRSPSSADLVRSTPQFGPFLGEVPPPVPAAPSLLALPQLQPQQQQPAAQYPPLPLSVLGTEAETDADNGQLPLLHTQEQIQQQHHQFQQQQPEDPFQSAASDHHEQEHGKVAEAADKDKESDTDADIPRERTRTRRSPNPHHEPGHEGHGERDGQGAGSEGSGSGAASSALRLGALRGGAGVALGVLCAMFVSAWSADLRVYW